MTQKARSQPPAENYTVRQVCDLKNIGVTMVYAALNSGALVAVKVGKKTLIPAASVEAWWASFPSWKPSTSVARISPKGRTRAASCTNQANTTGPPSRR